MPTAEAEPSPQPTLAPAYYPDTGIWAVAARVSLLVAVAAIGYASLVPGRYVPRLLYSYHLEHFAAFYMAALIAAAAFPRSRLRTIGIIAVVMALVLEGLQMVWGRGLLDTYNNALSDVGGAFAAALPIAMDRFRRMFSPRSRAA